MKHTLAVTLMLAGLFFLAQLIGLGIVNGYLEKEDYEVEGVIYSNVTWQELPYGVERPAFDEKTSFLPLFAIILVATLLIFVIMKLRFFRVWKFWFFLSVWFCLTIAANVVFSDFAAVAVAGGLALLKVLWRNVVVHNVTELFIYGGLAAVFVPFLNLWSISILLVLISVYDAIAVWKTKHMVSMAQFQTKIKLFAGMLIPYGKKEALLGGGDIGFPLFFSGVVLKTLGLAQSIVVSGVTTVMLLLLLVKSQKNMYYPAMPYLSVGCFLGFLFASLI